MEGFGGSVAGGGRYDKMIGKFTGNDTPACGFSDVYKRQLIVLLVAVHVFPMLHIMSIGSMAIWAYFIIDRQICPAKITFHFLFPPVRLVCNRNPVFVFFHIFIDHFVIQKMILFCLMFQILDL